MGVEVDDFGKAVAYHLLRCKAPLLCTTPWYGFSDRRFHIERLMWPDMIVLFQPCVDDSLSLVKR
jgi:capsid protein